MQLLVGLPKGVSCPINMHDPYYQSYNKMQNKFKKSFNNL